jgi:hypothetical protein
MKGIETFCPFLIKSHSRDSIARKSSNVVRRRSTSVHQEQSDHPGSTSFNRHRNSYYDRYPTPLLQLPFKVTLKRMTMHYEVE